MGSFGVATGRWLRSIYGESLPDWLIATFIVLIALTSLWAYSDWRKRR